MLPDAERVFTVYRVPELVLELLMSITTNKYILLFIIDIFLFIVGMIVNDTTGVLICAPLLMPVMNQLGISPIHFASIMGVNLAMGGVTPPYASILYLGMRIGKAEFHEILKPTMIIFDTGVCTHCISRHLLAGFGPCDSENGWFCCIRK